MTSETTIHNALVEAIVARAEGLPLYVRHVLDDLRCGEIDIAALPQKLPPSLSAYYDRLLRRMSIGDLQAVLTPLIVTLAWARAPLGEEILQLMLERRKALVEGEEGRLMLRRALETVQSIIRRQGAGYRLYHPRFQDHIRLNETGVIGQQNALARREFVALVNGWKELDHSGEAFAYSLQFGPSHLADDERWDELLGLLTDFDFIAAKCHSSRVYPLLSDFIRANAAIPPAISAKVQIEDLYRALDGNAHVLSTDPDLLVQQMYNDLVWRWDESSLLGQALRRAAETQSRPWLKRRRGPMMVPDPDLLRVLKGHVGPVNAIAFSPEGTRIASGGDDGTVRLWDTETGALLATLSREEGRVNAIAISPDGNSLADMIREPPDRSSHIIYTRDAFIRVWSLTTATVVGVVDTRQSGGYSQVHPLSGSQFAHRLNSHSAESVTYSPDGLTLAIGTDREIQLRSAGTGELIQVLQGHRALSVAFSPDGQRLASAGSDKTVRVWDVATGRLQLSFTDKLEVYSALFSPDAAVVAVATSAYCAHLFDAHTGEGKWTLFRSNGSIVHKQGRLQAHPHSQFGDRQTWVAYSPDGVLFAVAGNNAIFVRQVESWDVKQVLVDQSSFLRSLAWSPLGSVLATGSEDGTVKVWHATGQTLEQRSP